MTSQTHHGIAKGKTIELESPLPYPDGQPVTVYVERREPAEVGRAERVCEAIRAAPHLRAADVDELERSLAAGQAPASYRGVFDGGRE